MISDPMTGRAGVWEADDIVQFYKYIMTGGIQTFADNRQTYKHYINSLKHVYKVLNLA
jgi:hypothetical protein